MHEKYEKLSEELHELEVETFEIEDFVDLHQNAADGVGCTSTSSTSTCTSSTSTSSTSATSRPKLPPSPIILPGT